MPQISEVFAPDGVLAAHLPGFSYREPQQRMAELVGQAIAGSHAMIEAGTGIGKTYAYVVPILLAGGRAIISTGTRTLQDQLFSRDLPALGRALGRPVDIALLKGRGNYLCRHRLELTRLDSQHSPRMLSAIDSLARWTRLTDSGDLTEIDDLEGDYRLRARVTSTIDNCLGSDCPELEDCFVLRARRRAQAAQVVIVNHHLLLADLELKAAGFGELLPLADAVVVDEAHLLPDIAQQYFDVSVSSRQLTRIGLDIADEARVAGVGRDLETAAQQFAADLAPMIAEAARQPGRRAGVPRSFAERFAAMRDSLLDLADQLEGIESEPGLTRCRERCVLAAERLNQVLGADADRGLQWFEAAEQGFSAHFTPFDVGHALGERITAQGGSWIFTSASLAVRSDFSHFTTRLGVTPEIEAVLASPFDYAAQGGLYLPSGLPAPNQDGHTEALLELVWPLLQATQGGAFLLFTSHRALALAEHWFAERTAPGPVYVQGAGSKSRLLEDFRAAGNGILLGTGSFWQGVDVRGAALRLVVIDKLPFAVPSDPLIQARVEAIRRNGGEPFTAFQLPEAVLALKQGVGRLIRDYDDHGLVVLGDPRLQEKSYGRVFLDSLPPFTRLEDPADALVFAESLAAEPATMSA